MNFYLLKFLHLTSLTLLFSASIYKNIQVHRKTCDHQRLQQMIVAEMISGITATLMVISGVAMLLHAYPQHLYRLQSTSFWLKMSLLVVTTVLIIMSKMTIRKLAKAEQQHPNLTITIPIHVKLILGIDLFGLALMALLAIVMVGT